jgi:MFS family permease
MEKKPTNRNLFIIGLIAVVNALGYGIIFPILYSYSQKYGLSDFQNGLLFALFSICQFLSTPIIGRMSDKFGRKPLLVISLAGTFVSFVMMAFAPSAIFLFIARALDGLTAGNLPVAQAVISDSTAPEERAKGFGMIGASFSFGFIFGPLISTLTVGYSAAMPFILAAVIALIGTVLTALYLPETNKHMGDVRKGKLFDFAKMWHSLFDPNVGVTFVITLFFMLAFSLFIYAFQPYSVKVLGLSAEQISLIFTAIGVVGLVTQMVIVPWVTKTFHLKHTFRTAILLTGVAFLLAFLSHSYIPFIGAMMLLSVANGHVQPLINAILSRETDERSQGTMLGLNVSYASIGQILGPLLGGAVATYSVHMPFLAAAVVVGLCFVLSFQVLKPGVKKEAAF